MQLGDLTGSVYKESLNRGFRLTRRARDLKLPNRDEQFGGSFHEAERHLFHVAGQRENLLSLTHVDLKRFPPPEEALSAYTDAVNDRIDVFTSFQGDGYVRRALAPRISEFLGVDVDPETELAITAGTQSALFSVLSSLIQAGDTVLLPDPDYVSSERMIRFLGADIRYIPQLPSDAGTVLDLGEIEHGLKDGARMLVFSNPCNPTGAVYGQEFLAELAALVVRYDAYVLVDELYARLVYDAEFHHLISEPGIRERCITTLGTSKFESMSGYRVGTVVAPAHIIHELSDIVSITALRPSSYSERTLLGWMDSDRELMAERLRTFTRLRDMTVEHFSRFDFIDLAAPQGTAYAFPRFKDNGLNDYQVAEAIVEQAGLLVYPGLAFGPSGAGGFRLCFAQNENDLPDILDRVTSTLASLY